MMIMRRNAYNNNEEERVCVSRLVTCSRTELYSKIWAIAPCAAYVASKLQASPA